ncbi:undecaprenyl-phosphate galactose phosphotransferase WbaP [Pluralibacter gergoviae]|uniref:Undecaprenyl-phosphate galactose phosphotransferase WbaP n=1 Tax=Pluralibacter gergoviae TaxID=61647 RepID=A0AAI9GLI9_PLUGE|nr:undecaprenyl-phosphate galactose phosphotransferase WbaP [Pluralibacter gergoviae]EKV0915487.1 undecaprenyl-phosphate galactose phosphotransferase WbaP [Pluralibacter gergoviae]EKW7273604.1 undecaprenyl-phosphate galactose phosphotransferase WbaP [Pluralibacter gergoviae]EKW9974988.1 undecaprenyl-phosphate galactose phosphotransferase WbaP [Pluralibacter gergoviae]ELD4294843.1 undecaprenyl-phosphate galactose phosphotransferase WbaP [Pluralibacter gergoviae]ELD4307630.1 undecaprenyl-phospha
MTPFKKNLACSISLIIADFISFTLSLYIAIGVLSILLHNFHERVPDDQIEPWISLHWLLGICCVGWFGIRLRHYFYRKTFWLELKEVFRTLLIFAIFEMAIIAFAKWYFSRYVWLFTWTFAALLFPMMRMFVKYLLNIFKLWLRDTWIIGDGANAREAFNAINSEVNLGLRIVGFISNKKNSEITLSGQNLPVIKKDFTWLKSIDKNTQFIVAVESEEGAVRNSWLKEFMIRGYRYVSVIPTLRGMPLDSTDMAFIFSHEVMIFRVQQNLAKWSSRLAKRLFDIIGSLIIIILLSPLLIYISFKVRQDGGASIYGHLRVGKGGHLFKCLKFRSMVVNSKEVLEHLLENNIEAKKEWESTFKLKKDPRVTPIGQFLRRTSLDELPQLFNVIKGEMSLVGPRPIVTEELERYNDEVDYYLLSKPGMTGLWQVSGRSDVDYDTRVYLDAWYVKNWSMWNDIAILFKTINVVFNKNGAY